MAGLFQGKKIYDLGIIVGETHSGLLSLDNYVNRYLLPYTPRFRSIDFAIASLETIGVNTIFVFAENDKEFVSSYLMREWPFHRFYVFDNIDLKNEFYPFFLDYLQENPAQSVVMIHGDYPVWFDMKKAAEAATKHKLVAVEGDLGVETINPALFIDRQFLLKRMKIAIDSAEATNGRVDITVAKIAEESRPATIRANGYFMPVRDLRQYYQSHIDMLEDYYYLDHYNSVVPVKREEVNNRISDLKRGSHVINSLIGEDSEVYGTVENSIIFKGVKIAEQAVVRNSIILPGNHIGRKATVINSIIDEFSGDNSLPNIEKNCVVGVGKVAGKNKDFPSMLDFGVTLVGKDIFLPPGTIIGGNCYIESFLSGSALRSVKTLANGASLLAKDAGRNNPL